MEHIKINTVDEYLEYFGSSFISAAAKIDKFGYSTGSTDYEYFFIEGPLQMEFDTDSNKTVEFDSLRNKSITVDVNFQNEKIIDALNKWAAITENYRTEMNEYWSGAEVFCDWINSQYIEENKMKTITCLITPKQPNKIFRSEDWIVNDLLNRMEEPSKQAIGEMEEYELFKTPIIINFIISDYMLDDDSNPYTDNSDVNGIHSPTEFSKRIISRIYHTLKGKGY